MKLRLKKIVFFLGILITITGYYVDKANHFDFIMNIVAPEYLDLKSAFEELEQDRNLEKGSPHFNQILKLIKKEKN
jgi:hypothetical protein